MREPRARLVTSLIVALFLSFGLFGSAGVGFTTHQAYAQDEDESGDNADLNTNNEDWRVDVNEGWTPGDGTCPSLEEVQKAFGKDGDQLVAMQACQFGYRNPGHPIDLTCAKGYVATSDRGPVNKMFECVGGKIRVEALTIYPLIDFNNDLCAYTAHELFYAHNVMNGSIYIISGSKSLNGCPGVKEELARWKSAGKPGDNSDKQRGGGDATPSPTASAAAGSFDALSWVTGDPSTVKCDPPVSGKIHCLSRDGNGGKVFVDVTIPAGGKIDVWIGGAQNVPATCQVTDGDVNTAGTLTCPSASGVMHLDEWTAYAPAA